MNSIKIILSTVALITSHTAFNMHTQQLFTNVAKIEAEGTSLALRYLNEEDQKHFFENIHTIRDNNLGKSDPTVFLLMEKAKKIRD
jgi:hypothetical protein